MEKFWSKVDKTPGHGPKGDCWVWTASIRNKKAGYGAFKFEGKVEDTHRVAYKIQIGPIPEGLLVCHECDNRLCVRGDHLFLGTHKDNTRDALTKNRMFDVATYNKINANPKHGTTWMYFKERCRCIDCKKAKSEHNRNYKHRKKLKDIVV